MPDLYQNIDQKKTIDHTKQFLKEFHVWKVESARFHSWLTASEYETTNEYSEKNKNISLPAAARARFECDLRIKTIQQLRSLGEKSAMYADLLEFRYIKEWSVVKVCDQLASKYQLGYMAERTYSNYLIKALWEFSIICPRNLMVER